MLCIFISTCFFSIALFIINFPFPTGVPTSPISLENYSGMDDVTMVKNDDNTFSLTYQTQTVIQKGDFILRDQKLKKYTLDEEKYLDARIEEVKQKNLSYDIRERRKKL